MHPSDIILLPPFAGGLLVWPVFRMLSQNCGLLFAELRKIFIWTAIGLALAVAIQCLIGFLSSAPVLLMPLFGAINFISLMVSLVAFVRFSTRPVRVFFERNFIGVVGIPGFTLMVMFLVGGCRDLDIALHEGRATATVLSNTSTSGRRSVHYSYEVGGRDYRGRGKPGNPPYPPGSTFEIRYCTLHPSFSTPRNPFEFIGIICVGSAFAGFGWLASRNSKRWKNAASP